MYYQHIGRIKRPIHYADNKSFLDAHGFDSLQDIVEDSIFVYLNGYLVGHGSEYYVSVSHCMDTLLRSRITYYDNITKTLLLQS